MVRQLYRPKNNRVIAGVCGGFSEYFNIDPTIIRIVCFIICMTGTGFLAYIIAAIIMPDEDKISDRNEWNNETGSYTEDFPHESEKEKNEWTQPAKYDSEKNRLLIGAILVGLGVLFLVKLLIPWFDLKFFIPLLLIGIGGFIIYKGRH